MKLITIFFTALAIYFVWQISRESLGYAIICGCVSFVILLWLNSGCDHDERKASIRYKQAKEAAREQNKLLNN